LTTMQPKTEKHFMKPTNIYVNPESVSKIYVTEERTGMEVMRVFKGTSEDLPFSDSDIRTVDFQEDGYIWVDALKTHGFENFDQWFFKDPEWDADDKGKFYYSRFSVGVHIDSMNDPDVTVNFFDINEEGILVKGKASSELKKFISIFPNVIDLLNFKA
jgi:hypothetical protein